MYTPKSHCLRCYSSSMTISQNGEEKLRGGKEKEEEKKDKYSDGNKGRLPLPKRMNFRKVILQFFSEIHDRSIVYNGKNLQHKFLD